MVRAFHWQYGDILLAIYFFVFTYYFVLSLKNKYTILLYYYYDDFSYFDWLNRLAKFRHGVLPDHVSFCGNFLMLKISELDGLCPRPSIFKIQNK